MDYLVVKEVDMLGCLCDERCLVELGTHLYGVDIDAEKGHIVFVKQFGLRDFPVGFQCWHISAFAFP